MTKSKKLELALEQIKTIQKLETLGEADIVALQKVIQGKQSIAILPTTKLVVQQNLT